MSKDVELLKEMREHFVEEMSVEIKRPLSNTNKINKFGEYAWVLSNAIQRMKEQSMTEKLGVLLKVPKLEPLVDNEKDFLQIVLLDRGKLTIHKDELSEELCNAYKCTQEEAKEYPQFRWVALEELK